MKAYVSKSKIVGPCGPCSFINLTGIKGSIKLEKELAEIGRIKPFHASSYTAFLSVNKESMTSGIPIPKMRENRYFAPPFLASFAFEMQSFVNEDKKGTGV